LARRAEPDLLIRQIDPSAPAAGQADQPDLLARCLNVSAYVLIDLGEASAACACAEEALALYVALRNRAMEVDCLSVLSGILLALGEHPAALSRARTALAISDEIGNAWGQVFSRFHLADALAEGGDAEAAERVLVEALTIGEGAASPFLLSLCRNALGAAQRALGDVGAALATHLANTPAMPAGPLQPTAFGTLADLSPPAGLGPPTDLSTPAGLNTPADRNVATISRLPADFGMADFAAGVRVGDLCADYAVLGRWAEAAACARFSVEAAHLVPAYARVRTLWYEVEALARSGDIANARRTLDAFASLSGDTPRYRVAQLRAEAILATPEEAAALRDEALAIARQLNLPVEIRELEAHEQPPTG
jgi:tetratricopeptide (TPR) repeat protein